MRCSNCDARIPPGATSCPNCGVFALDEPPQPPAPPRRTWWPLVLPLVVVAAGAAFWLLRETPKAPAAKADPVHVVRGRPGGNIAEAEAIRELRHYLTARNIASECVAVMSHGLHAGSYQLTAYDRCKHQNLGPWQVDAKTHEVRMK